MFGSERGLMNVMGNVVLESSDIIEGKTMKAGRCANSTVYTRNDRRMASVLFN